MDVYSYDKYLDIMEIQVWVNNINVAASSNGGVGSATSELDSRYAVDHINDENVTGTSANQGRYHSGNSGNDINGSVTVTLPRRYTKGEIQTI